MNKNISTIHHKDQIITVHQHQLIKYIQIIKNINHKVGISYNMKINWELKTLRRILHYYKEKSKNWREKRNLHNKSKDQNNKKDSKDQFNNSSHHHNNQQITVF